MNFSQTVRRIYHEQREALELLDPISFAESTTGLNIKLYPAQRFILKSFYKIPLSEKLEPGQEIVIKDEFNENTLYTFSSEIEFFDFLYREKRINMSYDDWNTLDNNILEVVFICGRRASKTTLTTIITIHQLYILLSIDNPHDYFGIMRSDPITISLVSNNEAGAVRTFKAISDLVTNSKYFDRYVSYLASNSLWLATEQYKMEKEQGIPHSTPGNILIRSFAAGPSVRGASNIVTIIDEIDHFRDASSKRIDPEMANKVYEALTPSILGFVDPNTGKGAGKSFIMSSPNGKRGILYDFYQKSFNDKSTLMLHTPSNWINNRIAPDILKRIYNQSETSFRQEIRAEFIDPISNWISQPDRLLACFNKALPNTPYQTADTKHYMGIDLAFSSDRAVIAIGHIQSHRPELSLERPELENLIAKDGNFYVIDYIDIMKPRPGEPISVFDVIARLKELFVRFDIAEGTFDQFSGQVFEQLIEKESILYLKQEPATQMNNSDRAMTMKQIIVEGRLQIPYVSDVIEEFMGLQEEVLRDGLVRVANDRFHDDSYTAISRVIELCFRHKEIVAERYVSSHNSSYRNYLTTGSNKVAQVQTQRTTGTGNATRDMRLSGLSRRR